MVFEGRHLLDPRFGGVCLYINLGLPDRQKHTINVLLVQLPPALEPHGVEPGAVTCLQGKRPHLAGYSDASTRVDGSLQAGITATLGEGKIGGGHSANYNDAV